MQITEGLVWMAVPIAVLAGISVWAFGANWGYTRGQREYAQSVRYARQVPGIPGWEPELEEARPTALPGSRRWERERRAREGRLAWLYEEVSAE